MRRLALGDLGVVDQEVERAVGDREGDAVAVAHEGERATDGGFRRDMENDRAVGGAAHAGVGDADHVLDPARASLPGIGR